MLEAILMVIGIITVFSVLIYLSEKIKASNPAKYNRYNGIMRNTQQNQTDFYMQRMSDQANYNYINSLGEKGRENNQRMMDELKHKYDNIDYNSYSKYSKK
jgi:hypothetical protein